MNILRKAATALLLAATLSACAMTPPAPAERVLASGRNYLLLDARRGLGPAPLVVALHGGGGSASFMMQRWADTAREQGFILAVPNGTGRMPGAGTWNASGCCGEAQGQRVDDIAFINQVIADAVGAAQVDQSRIFVVGFSNGGMLAHRIAIAEGRRLAGVAVVAGGMFGDEAPAQAPVPMMMIHGRRDTAVPYEGGVSPNPRVARFQTQPFLPVRQALEYWRRADGCTDARAVETEGDATIENYDGCAVRLVSLNQEEHGWPRGTTAMIWNFFRALPSR
ncbi:hypothetical protein EOD42_03785 [Rhodovarius crocodyli]|uniref:Phospholipase/carboxylesterase/thioesterase domain-containing protein n=1 Tax=Rhodovarius crocodyli TaxID=1979269 RepID=A0A437MNK1_9PROT|nr:PHB depolymerase family esterase [Rhodovarius crocodyli]RVT99231.1 hypothetical protein EOD42_03785 [Rhodovarius crocodyli]